MGHNQRSEEQPQDAVADAADLGGLAAAVAAHPFLQNLSTERLDLLSQCAQLRNFQPGQLIFKQGDSAHHFYLIVRGVVLLSHAGLTGNVAVQTLTSGDALGWSWLFPPFAWHFNAMTLEPSQLIEFDGERVHELCREHPEFGYEFLGRIVRVVIDRLQNTRHKMFHLTKK